ncbi:MAG: protein kinase [Planctomycetota bacterium]|jgi:serine/threonine protein kinase|nr:protein kinase [Planctomycetota bacterium]
MAAAGLTQDKRIRCTGCNAKLRLPAGTDPSMLRCPRCGTPVQELIGAKGTTSMEDGRKVIAGYRLTRKIARGGMGVVYECKGPKDDGPYAIKVMSDAARDNPECVIRFKREGRIGMLIDHPAVVSTFVCDEADGQLPYMVMELIDGVDMSRLVKAEGAMPWRRAVDYAIQVAGALAVMGELGVVHRDIKPQNILIAKNDRAKLADFGLAKHIGDDDGVVEEDGVLTVTGTQMGTPAYMPPEQIDDSVRVSPAADVYSLAATLYHLVTGQRPFPGKGAVKVMEKVLYDEPQRPKTIVKDVPPALDELIMWCLEKNARLRPPNGVAMEGLLRLVRQRPEDVQAVRDARGTLARRGSSRLLLALVLVLVPLIAVGLFMLLL